MPTNPTAPNTNASVDRLTLGIASPRGNTASTDAYFGSTSCNCFEAGASAVIFGCYGAACFEAEASWFCGLSAPFDAE